MKKALAALLAAALWAAPAFAATYYVGGGGNNSLAGTSYATRWATIAKANTAALPGDVVYIYPNSAGPYADFPNPDSAGSNPTGGGIIRFIGASGVGDTRTNVSARYQVSIASGSGLTKPYTSIHGVTFTQGLTLAETADRCSVYACTANGNIQINGADYSYVTTCISNGSRLSVGYNSSSGNNIVGTYLTDNTFPMLGYGVAGDVTSIMQFGRTPSTDGSDLGCRVDSLRFLRNRSTIELTSQAGDTHPRILFYTRYSRFEGNYHSVSLSNPNITQYLLRMRDSTYRDTLVRDTVIATGPGKGVFFLSSCGRSDWCPTVFESVIDSCYWNGAELSACRVEFQNGMYNARMRHNTIVMNGLALRAWNLKGKNKIESNTFVGARGYVVDFSSDNTPGFGGAYTDTCLIFRNNIVYNASPAGQSAFPGYNMGGVKYNTADFDSGMATTQHHAQRRLVSNNNLYFFKGFAVRPHDRSIINLKSSTWRGSVPGDSSASIYDHIENRYGADSLSKAASPLFGYGGPDSSFTSAFNPRLSYDSPGRGMAIDIGSGETDAGSVTTPTVPEISLDKSFITFVPNSFESSSFTIINLGTGTLTVSSIASSRSGITVSPASASVAAGATQVVTVTYASGLTDATITIVSDDPTTPTTRIPVFITSLTISEP